MQPLLIILKCIIPKETKNRTQSTPSSYDNVNVYVDNDICIYFCLNNLTLNSCHSRFRNAY